LFNAVGVDFFILLQRAINIVFHLVRHRFCFMGDDPVCQAWARGTTKAVFPFKNGIGTRFSISIPLLIFF
jgi:hypothetical protein